MSTETSMPGKMLPLRGNSVNCKWKGFDWGGCWADQKSPDPTGWKQCKKLVLRQRKSLQRYPCLQKYFHSVKCRSKVFEWGGWTWNQLWQFWRHFAEVTMHPWNIREGKLSDFFLKFFGFLPEVRWVDLKPLCRGDNASSKYQRVHSESMRWFNYMQFRGVGD